MLKIFKKKTDRSARFLNICFNIIYLFMCRNKRILFALLKRSGEHSNFFLGEGRPGELTVAYRNVAR